MLRPMEGNTGIHTASGTKAATREDNLLDNAFGGGGMYGRRSGNNKSNDPASTSQ